MSGISHDEYVARIAKVAASLPENVDAAIVTSEINRRYICGFLSSDGYVVITREKSYFLTDYRYVEAARNYITWCEVVGYMNMKETLGDLVATHNIKTAAIEIERTTILEADGLDELFAPAVLLRDNTLDSIINEMRIHKSEAEVELMRRAQIISEDSLHSVLKNMREGMSERDLAIEIEYFMKKNGAERIAFDLIIASGENGSMPHAVPGERTIRPGDLITFDIGAVVDGYHSDMTRTVAFGNISEKQREVYYTVLGAQKAAMEYVENGGQVLCECDAAARDFIANAGYGDYFTHSTGHGVGLEIHEKPGVHTRAKDTIPLGSIITVEPGIYLEGQFGVRIENMIYKTENSMVNLTTFERELIIL